MITGNSENASCSSLADEDVETTQSVLHAAVAGKNIGNTITMNRVILLLFLKYKGVHPISFG